MLALLLYAVQHLVLLLLVIVHLLLQLLVLLLLLSGDLGVDSVGSSVLLAELWCRGEV